MVPPGASAPGGTAAAGRPAALRTGDSDLLSYTILR